MSGLEERLCWCTARLILSDIAKPNIHVKRERGTTSNHKRFKVKQTSEMIDQLTAISNSPQALHKIIPKPARPAEEGKGQRTTTPELGIRDCSL